jgi:hypothetical protein
LGNFSDLLRGLSNSKEFVKGKGRSRQNENFILEAVKKEQIIFTDFGINNQQVEDSMEDMSLEDKKDVKDLKHCSRSSDGNNSSYKYFKWCESKN